jgi:pimeloyl-ACP methyl ester carboxylesterase
MEHQQVKYGERRRHVTAQMTQHTTVVPFTIQIADEVLSDLQERLRQTRWPDEIDGAGWDYGTNLDYLQQLVAYWRDGYDWRAQERLLNHFPQFQATVDGFRLHFLHLKGQGPRPLPLILSHGWPGSFFEMCKVVEPLADPARHGGSAEDAFDVVVPSLPGYGFSERPHTRGMNVARIAELFLRLMREELGYPRFGAQGGDWGSVITARLGAVYPAHLVGIHLNMDPTDLQRQDRERLGGLGDSPELQRWRAQLQHYQQDEGAYSRIQGTRPQTLAYGLTDSPVGLAGWIVEKFRAWSDCQGEVEHAFTKDELLTNIMIYWVTNTINSSMRLYYEFFHAPAATPGRVEVPTGVAAFPNDIVTPVRSLAEQAYNIQHWTDMLAGGHFAALEQPAALVEDIRAFFRPLRPGFGC